MSVKSRFLVLPLIFSILILIFIVNSLDSLISKQSPLFENQDKRHYKEKELTKLFNEVSERQFRLSHLLTASYDLPNKQSSFKHSGEILMGIRFSYDNLVNLKQHYTLNGEENKIYNGILSELKSYITSSILSVEMLVTNPEVSFSHFLASINHYKLANNKFMDLSTLLRNNDYHATHQILGNIINFKINSTTYLIFIFLLMIAISFAVSHFFTKDLLQIIHTISEVATGKKINKTKFNSKSKEIKEIAMAVEAFQEVISDLEEANTKIHSALKAKDNFLSNMSHELRTPMHAIMAYSSMSIRRIDKWDKNKQKQNSMKIYKTGERLTKLLNNLLDLSKFENDKMVINYEKTSLIDIIQSVLLELGSLLDHNNLSLNINKPLHMEPILCDGEKISQVVTNLLSNAIKFSDNGSTINVDIKDCELSYNGNCIPAKKISIVDHGIGIPDDELRTIFNKFTQSRRTNKGAGGTGLGLAICQEIIDSHNGIIMAMNNKEKGSTFYFILPTDPRLANNKEQAT